MTKLNPTNRERYGVPNRRYGLWRGIVTYNIDPRRLGRVKIRIPPIHGTEISIGDGNLLWSWPVHSQGGAYDVGSYIVPPVGATVFVFFEQGDPQYPYYLGGWYKDPPKGRIYNTKTSPVSGKLLPNKPISEGTWVSEPGIEIPKEARATPYEPSVTVLHKTKKGHTVWMEDRDGYEALHIVDRSGQQLTFNCGVTDEANDGNAEQRGVRTASDGDPVPYSSLIDGCSVELLSQGQKFRMISKEGGEFVEIESGNETDGANLKMGVNSVEIRCKADGEPTVQIHIDVRSGTVSLDGVSTLSVTAEFIAMLAAQINLAGDVSVAGNLSVGGKLS